jgi:hypothetical protein
LIVSKDHSPEGATGPKVELCRGQFSGATALGWAVRTGAVAFAEAASVDSEYGESAFSEGGSGGDGGCVGAEEFVFADVVLAAVPVAVEDSGGGCGGGGGFWEEEVSAHGFGGPVIELKLFEPVRATVFFPKGDGFLEGAWGKFSEERFQFGSNCVSLLGPFVRRARRDERWRVGE